jgi:hypothetical protein
MSKKRNRIDNLDSENAVAFSIQSLQLLKDHYSLNKTLLIQIAYVMGFKSKDIAEAAKCSQDYVRAGISRYKKIKKCREQVAEILGDLPDFYREVCRHRLPQLALAEGKALDLYCEKPEKLIEKPTLARQIKAAAGVSPEPEDGPTTVNIAEVRNLMIQMTAPEKLMPPDRELITVGSEEPAEEDEG